MVHLPFGALWIVHFTASPQARIRSGFLVARGAAWGPRDAGDHRDTDQILQGWALEQCQPNVTLGSRGRGSEYPPLPRCRGSLSSCGRKGQPPTQNPGEGSQGPALPSLALSPLKVQGWAPQRASHRMGLRSREQEKLLRLCCVPHPCPGQG